MTTGQVRRQHRERTWVSVGLATALAITSVAIASAVGAQAPSPSASGDPTPGTTRLYHISADQVSWDFAPQGRDAITGLPFGPEADVFVRPGPDRIGSVYEMSQYREYTDATFTTLKEPADDSLGILGPVIRAEVGDTIEVVFRNATPFPASIHPHGVFYDKASEGAPYDDGSGTGLQIDDAVPPGQVVTYHWQVPERAGPGPMDPSSILWMYHSHTDEVRDTNSGLVGPMVITRAGMARQDGSPSDVDRELFAYFSVMDQNQSLYLPRAMERLEAADGPEPGDEEAFEESNLMHAVNGYVFGNGPLFSMVQGTRVRWYLMALGTEVDLHTPHWHGNTVLMNGMNRSDMVQLLPGGMMVADMVPDDPGVWLFHCHVNDHITAGMQARYEVLPAGTELAAVGAPVATAAGSQQATGSSAADSVPAIAQLPFWCRLLFGDIQSERVRETGQPSA